MSNSSTDIEQEEELEELRQREKAAIRQLLEAKRLLVKSLERDAELAMSRVRKREKLGALKKETTSAPKKVKVKSQEMPNGHQEIKKARVESEEDTKVADVVRDVVLVSESS